MSDKILNQLKKRLQKAEKRIKEGKNIEEEKKIKLKVINDIKSIEERRRRGY